MAFEQVRTQLANLILRHGLLECKLGKVTVHRNMVWLPVAKTPPIVQLHEEIDKLLLTEFGIPQDNFDKDFNPHISLFTSGGQEQIQKMNKLLQDEDDLPRVMTIIRFVIGSSGHKDVFYEV